MNGRRILVVDDEEALREITALSMEAFGGHQVSTASSGAEAIVLAAEQLPDAILLDVMMPGLDGVATAVKLQEDPITRDIQIILLTAKVQTSDRARFALVPGVRGVIAKPFDPVTLPQQVAELLGWSSEG